MDNIYSIQIDNWHNIDTNTINIDPKSDGAELLTKQNQEEFDEDYFTTKDGKKLKIVGKYTGFLGEQKLILENEDNSWLVVEKPVCEDKAESNLVDHPSHYTQGSIECIDAMVSAYGIDAVMNFCQCNAFKYLWRFNHKNNIEDLDKLQWYINKYKDLYQLKEQSK